MADARKFTGEGLTAGSLSSETGGDTLAQSLKAAGFDLSGSTPAIFQLPALASELKSGIYSRVAQLSELQKAQESGIAVKGLDEKIGRIVEEVTQLLDYVRSNLERGILPQGMDPRQGFAKVDAPHAQRNLTQALLRGQGYFDSYADASRKARENQEDKAFREEERRQKREDKEAERLNREAERYDAEQEKAERGAYRGSLSGIRTDARVARVKAELGMLPPEVRAELTFNRDKLLADLPEKMKEYEAAKASGDTVMQHIISQDIGAANNLAKELTNVLEYNNKENKNSMNNTLKFISNIVATLGIASMASRVFLTEPYQFGTRPALGVLGKQGEVGSALSDAYGELEQYNLSINQQALGAGSALIGGGLLKGGKLGIGMAAGGAVVGALGLEGVMDDIWRGTFGTSEDKIIEQSIVQKVADPQRLVSNFVNSRTGLMAAGGLSADNMGYDFGRTQGSENSTGNSILNRMIELRKLGYSQEDMGQLLSGTALSLHGNENQMTDWATQAGMMSSAFGISEESVLSNMQTAQRYGSQDAGRSLRLAVGSAADSGGNVTSYTTNVLVPALMKVTESLALQNLSRSSEDLEQQVYGLRTTIVGSGTNLGKLMETNPEALSRVMGSMNSAIGRSMDNPGMMAFDLSLGTKFSEIMLNEPVVMQRRFEAALNAPVFRDVDFSDKRFADGTFGIAALNNLRAITGMDGDNQLLAQLAAIIQGGGTLDNETYDAAMAEALKRADEAQVGRINTIVENEIGGLAASLSRQTDEMLITSASLVKDLTDLQGIITNFINDDRVYEAAQNGIDTIIKKMDSLLGESSSTPGKTSIFGIPIPSLEDPTKRELSTGGYTGSGGSHEAAGIVHANEYVISSNNVSQNRETLDRIQGGEVVSTPQKTGNVTYITLKVNGADTESIKAKVEEATASYIRRNRLNYV